MKNARESVIWGEQVIPHQAEFFQSALLADFPFINVLHFIFQTWLVFMVLTLRSNYSPNSQLPTL